MSTIADVQREQWILGALLHDHRLDSIEASQGLLDAVGLTAEDFSHEKVGRAFQAAETLLRQGKPADPRSVAEILTRGQPGALESILNGLRDLRAKAVPNRELLTSHSEKLRRLSALRRARDFHKARAEAISATDEIEAVADDMATFASSLSSSGRGYRLASEDVVRILEAQEEVQLGHRMPVVPTGIGALDELILGFRPTLSVIAGAPGVGKSALMTTVVENISNAFSKRSDGAKLGVFALEDGTEAITSRLVARHSGIPWGHIGAKRLSDYQLGGFQEGLGVAHRVMDRVEKFETDDGNGITASQLVSTARDWVLHRNVKIIFIDHLGELEPEDNDKEKHYLRVRRMVKELRSIAIRYSVPVVALHHLNREAQKSQDGRPALHHLAESDYLGRMCRLALGLWPGLTEDTLNISILKQTRGASGVTMGSKAVVLKRLKESAMVSNEGGECIDFSEGES